MTTPTPAAQPKAPAKPRAKKAVDPRKYEFTGETAEAHWRKTRADTPLGEETFSILAHLRRMAEIKGFMEPAVEVAQ